MALKRGGSMATACIAHSALRVHGISKPIIARFDQPHASSDGGALLLKAIDDRLGLTWRLASALHDRRQPGKVAHSLRDLLRQRVFGLACGYADCNDAARLVDDPIHKLLLERDPLDGAALGSQPTLSRFENAVGRADLYRLGAALTDVVLTYHRERLGEGVRLITIDLDATDDPTHGQQELALFNGYYDTWCYLPLHPTGTFSTQPLQHGVAGGARAGRWNRKRRIIMKAEVLCYPGRSRKDNPRFLVTNLPHRAATIYTRVYCGRGDMENRLKELQQGVAMDRTSCSRFAANQLRLLFSVAAYVLFQALQIFARATTLGAVQVWTLRERLLKVAVWVERSVRRIVLHLPQAFPWRGTWGGTPPGPTAPR